MGILSTYKTINKWQKAGLWTGLFFIFYTIFGFFILPVIIQKISVDKLTQTLGRQVSINKITFNPYSLLLNIQEININEKKSDESFFAIKHALINLQTISIFKLAPVLKEVNIDGLFLNTIRYKDSSFNFSDLIPSNSMDQTPIKKKEAAEPSKPFKFSIANITLSKSTIILNDKVTDKTHKLTDMELAIPFISNLNTHVDVFITPHFSVNFDGSPINMKGKSKPFINSQKTIIDLNLNALDLTTYFIYLPIKTNIDLKEGYMNLSCSIEFDQAEKNKSLPKLLLSGKLELNKIKINSLNKKPVFEMDKLFISMGQSEVLKGDINIEKIAVSSPHISLIKDELTGLNIYSLMDTKESDGNDDENKNPTDKKPFPVNLACSKIDVENALVTLNDTPNNTSGEKDIFSLKNFAVEDLKLKTETSMVNIGNVSGLNGSLNVYRLKNSNINFEALLPAKKDTTEPEVNKDNTSAWNAKIGNLGFEHFFHYCK